MKAVLFALCSAIALCSISFLIVALVLGLVEVAIIASTLGVLSSLLAVIVEPTAQEKRRDGGTYL